MCWRVAKCKKVKFQRKEAQRENDFSKLSPSFPFGVFYKIIHKSTIWSRRALRFGRLLQTGRVYPQTIPKNSHPARKHKIYMAVCVKRKNSIKLRGKMLLFDFLWLGNFLCWKFLFKNCFMSFLRKFWI